MAVVVNTSFVDNSTLFTAFDSAPSLFDLNASPWSTAFSEFTDGTQVGVIFDTDLHGSGTIIPSGGTFDVFGTGLLPGGAAPIILAIHYHDNAPLGTLMITSNAGLSVSASGVVSGFINSIDYQLFDGSYLFQFTGSASIADTATTLTATRARVASDGIDAEVRGSITVNADTGAIIGGTITGFTLITGGGLGEQIDVSGVSIPALTFMQDFLDQPAFEVMLGTLFSGPNTFNANNFISAQTLSGYGGNDTYNIHFDDVIVEIFGGGTDTAVVTLDDLGSYTLPNEVENLTLVHFPEGSIAGNGNLLANVILGANNATNTLFGDAGNDTITGGALADSLSGGSGNDVLTGNGGNDSLDGGDNNDSLSGGAGNDTLLGGAGLDAMNGGTGDDLYLVNLAKPSTTVVLEDTAPTEALSAGNDTISIFGGEGVTDGATPFLFTMAANFENLTLDTESLTIKVTGNALDNNIMGDSGNNTLIGMGGADTLSGMGGNNSLDGGLGDDRYENSDGEDIFVIAQAGDTISDGGPGPADTVRVALAGNQYLDLSDDPNLANVVFFGTGAVAITGNAHGNTLTGNAGNDSISGGTGFDTMNGGAGNDTFRADEQIDKANGDAGIDTVIAEAVSFTLGASTENLILSGGEGTGTGNALNNTLTSEEGIHTFFGGGGNDTFQVQADDFVNENAAEGIDKVIATLAGGQSFTLSDNVENLDLIMTGGEGVTGIGNALANIIKGTAGEDTLDGGVGRDTLIGGAGNDTYYVNLIKPATTVMLDDTVTELAGGGTDTLVVFAGVGVATPTFTVMLGAMLENLDVSEVDAGSTVNATGNVSANTITGNFNNNILSGVGGNDAIFGLDGADTLLGGDGNDILDGGGGVDSLSGGLGNDTFVLTLHDPELGGGTPADGIDTVTDTGGTDQITLIYAGGGAGVYTQVLGADFENLDANGVSTLIALTVQGNASANAIKGSTGNDTLSGLAGNDTIDGNLGNDFIAGGAGNDTLQGGGGSDALNGEDGDDLIFTDGGDSITGGAGTDLVISTVSFALAADTENLTLLTAASGLTGTGNDLGNVLTSGSGTHTLLGGLGNDTYNVTPDDTVDESGGGGIDLVIATLGAGQTFTLGTDQDNLTLLRNEIGGVSTGVGNLLANTIIGSSDNDSLNGGGGTDVLTGGDGNDVLDGGGFDGVVDSLVGGLGNDTFKLSLDGGEGTPITLADVISDEGGIDTLVFSFTNGGTSFSYTLGASFENADFSGVLSVTTLTVTGNGLNNSMRGSGGNDNLSGLLGNDTIDGIVGLDTILGGDGNDQIVYYGFGTVDGGGATTGDTLVFAGEGDILLANHPTFEHLTLRGGEAHTGTGNDLGNIMTSESGAHTLIGGGGNDTFNVQEGDNVSDGAGVTLLDLTIATLEGGQSFTIGGGIDRLTLIATDAGTDITGNGNELANLITGSIANDSLFGDAGNDTLAGGGGNDTLTGGTGDDSLFGGTGNDTYVVDSLLDKLGIEAVTGGTDTVQSSISWSLAALANYETLILTGGDNINGTGNALNNTLTGNTGNNLLDGGAGIDTYVASEGNDTYVIANAGDTLQLFEGGDPDAGVDTVKVTFAGSDFLSIFNAAYLENVTYTGAIGATLTGNGGTNVLTGGTGADTLLGGIGADTLNGGGGNDSLNGGTEVDSMVGGAGNDTFRVDSDDDSISELAAGGTDLVVSEANLHILEANIENLTLEGAGSQGSGNTLNNKIIGNGNANALAGGGGNDTVTGGAGADVFVFNMTPAVGSIMTITDFSQADDLLGLSNLIYPTAFGGEGPIVTLGTAAVGGGEQFIYTAATGALYYDADGDGAGAKTQIAIFSAATKPATLDHTDFVAFTGFIT